MDVSDVLEYANEKGFGLDGFNLREMFPKKTNWRELEGAQDSVSPTWELFKLQVRRQVLELFFKSMEIYSSLPRLYMRHWFGQDSAMRYAERESRREELLEFTKGPNVVAISLELDSVVPPILPELPKDKVLATGELTRPSSKDIKQYEYDVEHLTEEYHAALYKAGDDLAERAARVSEWASLAPCIDTLLIFEKTGHLSKVRGNVVAKVNSKISSLPLSQQRPVQCSFPGNTPGAEQGTLQVVFMSQDDCINTPDLFVSFDGRTNGYPLKCLRGTNAFVPQRRQLLCKRKILLLDFIQALNFYNKLPTTG